MFFMIPYFYGGLNYEKFTENAVYVQKNDMAYLNNIDLALPRIYIPKSIWEWRCYK